MLTCAHVDWSELVYIAPTEGGVTICRSKESDSEEENQGSMQNAKTEETPFLSGAIFSIPVLIVDAQGWRFLRGCFFVVKRLEII